MFKTIQIHVETWVNGLTQSTSTNYSRVCFQPCSGDLGRTVLFGWKSVTFPHAQLNCKKTRHVPKQMLQTEPGVKTFFWKLHVQLWNKHCLMLYIQSIYKGNLCVVSV